MLQRTGSRLGAGGVQSGAAMPRDHHANAVWEALQSERQLDKLLVAQGAQGVGHKAEPGRRGLSFCQPAGRGRRFF